MKRLLSLLLAMVLVFAMVPAAAAATAECEHLVTGAQSATQYTSLEDALASATNGTVKLLADAEAASVVLKPGVTLDLNGYTLTADVVIAMKGANVIDGANCAGGGLLKVAKNNLVYAQSEKQVAIPVWNGVDGYLFTKVTFQQLARKGAEGTGAAQYIFLPAFSNAEATALMADGGTDNGVTIKVCMTWNNGQSQQFYTYSDDLVKQVFDGTGKWVFDLQVSGIGGISDMVASPVVVTDTYAQVTTTGTALVAG